MRGRLYNPIVEGVSRFLIPFIQIFALYVITHGHYGPGGGFQGGVILAASIMLLRLTFDEAHEHRRFSPKLAGIIAMLGILIYAFAGLVPLAFGGNFLDYGYLPIPGLSSAELRYHGILIVEIGVGMVVWGTLVTLFDHLMGSEPSP
jgi:multicomponent Na+:H+ antiporter subunit B